jgi:hypothetical protein
MRRAHFLAPAGFAALIVLGAFLLARTRFPTRAQHLRDQLAHTATQLTTEPESIPASAIDQRSRTSHEAILAMRRDLMRLVAFEATYVADSGRPNMNLLPPYAFSVTPGSWVSITLSRVGWIATITSSYTSVRCTVSATILADSRTSIANPVVCVGAHSPVP